MRPVVQRAAELKRQHPDTIVLFRVDDFYEIFGDDALLVAREFQITLTSRLAEDGQRIPMSGVPSHSVDTYLARLIARGYRVAIDEQALAPLTEDRSEPEAAFKGETECLSAQLPLPF